MPKRLTRLIHCLENNVAFPSFWHQQEMVLHKHTIFCCIGPKLRMRGFEQDSGDELQLHQSQGLAQARTRSFGKRHEELFHLAGDVINLEPSLGQETVSIRKNSFVSLGCVTLRRYNGLGISRSASFSSIVKGLVDSPHQEFGIHARPLLS